LIFKRFIYQEITDLSNIQKSAKYKDLQKNPCKLGIFHGIALHEPFQWYFLMIYIQLQLARQIIWRWARWEGSTLYSDVSFKLCSKRPSCLLLITAKEWTRNFPRDKTRKIKGKMLQDKSKINNYDVR